MDSRLVGPQEGLELGEHLLGRLEIGAAGRKEQQAGACASGRRAHRFGFVAAVVHDDDAAAAERRDQLRFDVGSEGGAFGRSVQDPGASARSCRRAAMNVRGVPMAEGGRPAHPVSLGTQAVAGRHAGLHPDLSMKIGLRGSALPCRRFHARGGAVALVGDERQCLAGDVPGDMPVFIQISR